MTWIRSLCTAFAMYSRLPVPCGNWKKEDMQYSIGLFPLVGIVIGVLEYIWLYSALRASAADLPGMLQTALFLAVVLIACIIPVLVTGGIHVDGFMDTSDALSSWGDRGQKLQILSDPHIGAFSVISLITLAAFWIAAVAVIAGSGDVRSWGIFGLEFVLARTLSGLAAVRFQNARGEGTLWAFTDLPGSARRTNTILLAGIAILAAAGMLTLNPIRGLVTAVMSVAIFGLYRRRAYRDFGGITGDLEGWFLCRCEVAAACALAVVSLFTV